MNPDDDAAERYARALEWLARHYPEEVDRIVGTVTDRVPFRAQPPLPFR